MVNEQKSVTAALIEAGATLGSVLILAYYTDAEFRYDVDQLLQRAWYQLQRARWLAWWNSLPAWRKERYEQKHGPQEV